MLKPVQKTLPNGLRVLLLELPHVHSVSLALMVRMGPRHEPRAQNGISHLVEHLLFRGTRSHPGSLEFHVAVEALGGEINGLTQRDATTIHITVPRGAALDGLRLLGEVCTEPLMTGLDVERDVVLEEILDCTDAEGRDLDIDSISRRIIWQDHPLSLPVAGEVGPVETFTEADCRRHFRRTFVTENAVLVVAGPLNADAILRTAAAAFANMPRGRPMPDVAPPRPLAHPPVHVQPTDDSQVSMLLTYPAPHENHPDFSNLLLLKRVLDDGFGSRLRQAICEQRGLAYSLAVSVDAYADAALCDVELACAPKKLLTACAQTLDTLAELRAAPIAEDELDRAKTRHLADLEFALDDPSEICGWYGSSELIGCRVGYDARLAEIRDATPQGLHRMAQEMFDPERALLTLVGPVDEKTVRRLERLVGRRPGSAVWLQRLDDEDDVDDAPEPLHLRVVS